ncbi:hypothetical protein HIM_04389 [Hirsutella minnesotensis 3608]|uniref:Uncharacterized protein n=1 Tax=Hirsutella minnesotensis 3608 TaxID=1043627 RepID=A0A0F8A1L3_9HYPO|nr:hypothetical protein HIM_04389 [Hirsutella minnesotensis 3608]
MSSYVITGVSKGLGFEFLRQLSLEPSNVVIGIVRDKAATDKKVADELKGRSNIVILQADITDYEAIKRVAAETSEITGGRLDYLIANAGYVSRWDAYDSIGILGGQPQKLEEDFLLSYKTNVIANIHLINLYMPLILKGKAKKVIALSTGYADLEATREYDAEVASGYSISKAAMNLAVAKFSAQYKREGVLLMSICPGPTETGQHSEATQEQLQNLGAAMQKFVQYAPHFAGPSTPESSVRNVISVWENASIEKGDGGSHVSRHGNKQWL